MRQRQERRGRFQHQSPLRSWLDASPYQSPSMLLPAIKDQQIYLSLMSTFLTLAKQAGASTQSLHQVGQALLSAKGLDTSRMLQNSNQHQSQFQGRGLTYNWLEKGCSSSEMKNLVEKMEKEMLDARQKQKQFRCLEKYRRQKQEQIAPSFSPISGTKKDRFKRIIKSKYSKKPTQSSNFYKFDVKQILHNSFKAENECYKTVSNFVHLKTMYGHSSEQDNQCYSQVYNAIFDRSQKFIITGGQEGLIKVWHKESGTLLKTLRGHTGFICKIDTSSCNKYLLSSAGDGIRFFDLKAFKPLGGWMRQNEIDQITSFMDEGRNIFAFGENSQLYLLPEEVMLAKSSTKLQIQDFIIFSFAQLIEKDNASIIVISLSPQKTHLLLGLDTGQFLLVQIANLLEIVRREKSGQKFLLPAFKSIKAHYKDVVQIKWSQNSFLWATGGKDGRCCLWELKGDQIVLLNTLNVNRGQKGRKKRSYACTYICWNCNYSHFAAGFQECIDEQESNERGKGEVLIYSLHQQRVTYELSKDISLTLGGIKAMDSHPIYPNILLICEAEGHVILLDLFLGCVVNVFEERGYHILHPQFPLIPTECKFTEDGLYFIVSTQIGSVSLYGYDSKVFYSLSPTEQFFQTDFSAIEIQQHSMKAISLTLNFNEDINEYPATSIVSIKGQPYPNILKIDLQQLLYCLNNPPLVKDHFPQIIIDTYFINKIADNLRQGGLLEISYQKTYEQIQQNKQMTLFHQRERQFAKITSITNSKFQHFKHHPNFTVEEQNRAYMEEQEPIIRSRTRKLKRHAVERINYADDFEYHDSQEEDFDLIEQELPQQLSEDSSSSPEDEEPKSRSRVRRRDTRTRIRRQTRQSNPIAYNQPDEIDQDEERMATRSKKYNYRQNHQEQQEQNSESIPKKKIKQDNESHESQPKKYSRLRKHQSQDMEQPVDCYRCQFVKASKICDRCNFSQQYCYECSLMRGKSIRDKYKCLICLFLNNEAAQEYEAVSEEPYRATSRSKEVYLPQLQDYVRFFFQGYEQFLIQNVHRLNNSIVKNNAQFRLLPHTQDLQLLNTPLCKVKSIEYYFPVKGLIQNNSKRNPGKGQANPILMLIGLQRVNLSKKVLNQAQIMINNQEQQKQLDIFWVYYVPGHDYLLPEELYLQVQQRKLISKFENNQLLQLKDEQMQIIQISPFEDRYPQTIWKLLRIRKTEGKRLRANTKEIDRRINLWRASEEISYQTAQCRLQKNYVDRLIEQLEILLKEDSPFCIFIDYVDLEIYPLYRHQVAVGICLQAIYERLKNNYYTSLQSLKADFDRIYTNSLAFNGEVHTVTQSAKQLKRILYSLLSQEEELPLVEAAPQPQPQAEPEEQKQQQQPSHSKKTHEESNSKKEKKKRDSEQYIDPAYTVTEKRRTRQTRNRPRRQMQSSDYEQLEISLDQSKGVATRGGRGRMHQQEQSRRITRSRNKNV